MNNTDQSSNIKTSRFYNKDIGRPALTGCSCLIAIMFLIVMWGASYGAAGGDGGIGYTFIIFGFIFFTIVGIVSFRRRK